MHISFSGLPDLNGFFNYPFDPLPYYIVWYKELLYLTFLKQPLKDMLLKENLSLWTEGQIVSSSK